MSFKTLFVYNSPKLFEILDEIKRKLNIEVLYVDKKNYDKENFNKIEDYLLISDQKNDVIVDNFLLIDTPKKISNLIEQINLNFLRIKFEKQSHVKIGKYILNLNSRSLHYGDKSLDLTEKETNMLVYIDTHKNVSLKKLQESVWRYSSNLETHTVETHVYRLRKKILETFNNNSLIKSDKHGYFLDEK